MQDFKSPWRTQKGEMNRISAKIGFLSSKTDSNLSPKKEGLPRKEGLLGCL